MSAELWQAVLLRTVADAVLGVANESDRTTRVRVCEDARRYLTKPSRDLAEVCTMAGMEMQTVMERMRTQIANAPTPEELADNPRQSVATFTKAAAKLKQKRIPFTDRLYTINGETRTIAEWCERTGISLALAQSRLNSSWPPERALTLTKDQAKEEQRAEARRSYMVSAAERSARIKEGLRRSEALRGKPKRGTAPILYEHEGQWRSLKEWSEITGLPKATLYARITRQGKSISEAIEKLPAPIWNNPA